MVVGARITDSFGKTYFFVKKVDVQEELVMEYTENGQTKEWVVDPATFLRKFLKKDYKVVDVAETELRTSFGDWNVAGNPTLTYQWKELQCRAQAARALDALAETHKNYDLWQSVEIVMLGSNGKDLKVYACKYLKPNTLNLVPLTTDIKFLHVVPTDAISLTLNLTSPANKPVTCVLMKPKPVLPREHTGDVARGVHEQQAIQGFLAHFWLVGKSDVEAEVNMSLKVNTNLGIPALHNHRKIKAGEQLRFMSKRDGPAD